MAVVKITPEAKAALDELPTEIHSRVLGVFTRLAQWPAVSGAKPLRGNLAGQFRVRTGNYRVQFSVTGKGKESVVLVSRIGHRDGFYDD